MCNLKKVLPCYKGWTGLPARIKIRAEPFTTSSLSAGYEEAYTTKPAPLPSPPYYGMRLVFTYE